MQRNIKTHQIAFYFKKFSDGTCHGARALACVPLISLFYIRK